MNQIFKEDGQTVVEYGLITLLIAVVILVAGVLPQFGSSVTILWENISTTLASV